MTESKILEFKRPQKIEKIPTLEHLIHTAFNHPNQKQAESLYNQILAQDINSGLRARCYINLGNIYYYQKELRRAKHFYRQALEFDKTKEGWYNQGNVLEELHKYDEAITSYYKSLELDPNYEVVHFNLARLLAMCGNLWESKKHWLRYTQIGSNPHKRKIAQEFLED